MINQVWKSTRLNSQRSPSELIHLHSDFDKDIANYPHRNTYRLENFIYKECKDMFATNRNIADIPAVRLLN